MSLPCKRPPSVRGCSAEVRPRRCPDASLFGALLPVAYAPAATAGPLLDMLVTAEVCARTALVFVFYPYSDGFRSLLACQLPFVLTAPLAPGTFLRLAFAAPPNTGMTLLARSAGSVTWSAVSTALSAPSVTVASSCVVAWAPCYNGIEGIASIGFHGSVPPPATVVPCQFQTVLPMAALPGGSATTSYVCAFSPSRTDYGVRACWRDAWQTLKWAPDNWAVFDSLTDAYTTVVDAGEDKLAIVLLPGQLTAIAFQPRDVATGPAFGAQWAWVVTRAVPAGAVVFLWANDWTDAATAATAAYMWQAPRDVHTPPGTVVLLTGLATDAYRASVGVLYQVDAPVGDVYALTAFSAVDDDVVAPVTATYSCCYSGTMPVELIPGSSILARPWPCYGAIIPLPSCKRVCDWECERLALNRTECLDRWFMQTLPVFVGCEPCTAGCSGCACMPPGPFTATLVGSCSG